MKETTVKCDVCGKPKGETNHWWRGRVIRGRIVIARHSSDALKLDADLCGREDLHKWIDAQLEVLAIREKAVEIVNDDQIASMAFKSLSAQISG